MATCALNRAMAIVCDGLGGHSSGDKASRMAVQTISEYLDQAALTKEALRSAIEIANAEVLRNQAKANMRSTVAVVWIENDRALVGTVGDTRVYLFRDSTIAYQSVDHSLAQFDVAVGDSTPEEIRGSERRNRLLRALGSTDIVKPDIEEIRIRQGDAFLVCTDGCWEAFEERELVAALGGMGFEPWFAWVRQLADSRLGADADNNTAVALHVASFESEAEVGT